MEKCREYDTCELAFGWDNSPYCWHCDGYVPVWTKEQRRELIELGLINQPEWTQRQWNAVTQLKNEVTGWRQKHAEMLLELDKMRKPKRKPKYS